MGLHARSEPTPELLGRQRERSAFADLLEDVRSGQGWTVVVRGEAGVGKTALVDYVVDAPGLRVIRAVGVESEMELAFAGVHQLCSPVLDFLQGLPAPQRRALEIAFGVRDGDTPDRFLVGLAVLTLLAEAAAERPLVCVVDDAQWLDRASAQVLAFVARRLLAEPVGLIFISREPREELRGLPDLDVGGLPDEDARALLRSVVPFRLDDQVRDRVLAEARGNPLALLELPRGLSPAELAGGFGLAGAQGVPARVEESFRRRLEVLPGDTRRLLLLAAADPVGDAGLVWRAAERLEIGTSAAVAAEADGLVEIGTRVQFRHPLVRSAVYRAASLPERQTAHRALAEVTDRELDPDRRAWHLAAAAPGPDEEIAAELERSADRAGGRGGVAAAAAFLERSVALTSDPARRAARALAAAGAQLQAGSFDAARELLATAAAGPLEKLQRAQVPLLRGRTAYAAGWSAEAPQQLLKAARELESLDVALARDTYLEAWGAAVYAGGAVGVETLREISRAARSAPRPTSAPGPTDVLLDGIAVLATEGRAAAVSLLRLAAYSFAEGEISLEEGLRWGWIAANAATEVLDEKRWHKILVRQLQSVRDAGLLVHLPLHLTSLGCCMVFYGDFVTAGSLIAEADAIADATGTGYARYAAVMLAGFRGREADVSELTEAQRRNESTGAPGIRRFWCSWGSAILYNGLGRYTEALAQAQHAASAARELSPSELGLPSELIEAAARSGETGLALQALERLVEAMRGLDSDWALGALARSRALLSEGEHAEQLYREAIRRFGRTQLRPELARAQLVYGEWLRREGRRVDARAQLRVAHDEFTSIGMEAFGERARRELSATGATARKRTLDKHDELTPQEAQIADLARGGLSNPEIAGQLFLSPRTVEYHLGKVFTKLQISSRNQLHAAMPNRTGSAQEA